MSKDDKADVVCGRGVFYAVPRPHVEILCMNCGCKEGELFEEEPVRFHYCKFLKKFVCHECIIRGHNCTMYKSVEHPIIKKEIKNEVGLND